MNNINTEEFKIKVYEIVSNIPYGKVLTYGTIAFLLNRPNNSRLVGKLMSRAPKTIPSHRVVNHKGQTVSDWIEQTILLKNEGVTFKLNGCVDLKKHLWLSTTAHT